MSVLCWDVEKFGVLLTPCVSCGSCPFADVQRSSSIAINQVFWFEGVRSRSHEFSGVAAVIAEVVRLRPMVQIDRVRIGGGTWPSATSHANPWDLVA